MNRRAAALLGLLLLVAPLFASDKRVEVDPKTDFSTLRTFTIREGTASSRSPEITNKLTLKKVEDAVRALLTARGLKEMSTPDLIVTFSVSEKGERGAPPPGRRGPVMIPSASTLIIDMTRRDSNALVWRGVLTDAADAPATT